TCLIKSTNKVYRSVIRKVFTQRKTMEKRSNSWIMNQEKNRKEILCEGFPLCDNSVHFLSLPVKVHLVPITI
ncbi:hypothetical protein L9F63_018236, partial [Diploptera punctata]